MRTLLTLYNNVLNGVFPDHTAKPATTPTAKDGTPLKSINIDDLTIGWIQALFFQTGNATPNGNPELKDDSQIIDLMRQLFSTAEKQTINASGPVVFGPTNHEVEVDLTGGDLSLNQLQVPDFIGQKVHIYGVGSGIGDIAGGTGLYANGVFFTENTGGVFLTAISLTEFRVVPGVTADYTGLSVRVEQAAHGDMVLSSRQSKNNGLTAAQIFPYPVTFQEVAPICSVQQSDGSFSSVAVMGDSPSNNEQSVVIIASGTGTAITTTRSINFSTKGTY